jgi:peptidyl-prolyl cis-trans isomerase B (cyclophilin B)
VSPSRREREYARRRYEEWQDRLSAKVQRRRRRRRNGAAAAVALGVVGVVVATLYVIQRGDDPGDPAAGPTPTPSTSADPANPCPAPTVRPPSEPKTFDAPAEASEAKDRTWRLALATTCGDITLNLDGAKAPQATAVVVQLAKAGYFDGSPCHRLTTQGIFVLQCGDPTGSGSGGPGFDFGPVENAPKGDLYPAGTVAMARRSGDGKSMGSQFFLVYQDSTIPSDAAGGYTVLGRIDAGLDIVEKVAAGGVAGGGGDGAPVRAVSIESATATEEAKS